MGGAADANAAKSDKPRVMKLKLSFLVKDLNFMDDTPNLETGWSTLHRLGLARILALLTEHSPRCVALNATRPPC